MVSAQVRREQARFAIERGLSQRRACALMDVGRSCMRYEVKLPVKNAPVMEAMRALSNLYPRFGSRRIRVMLARQGMVLGKERCGDAVGQGGSASASQAAAATYCGRTVTSLFTGE